MTVSRRVPLVIGSLTCRLTQTLKQILQRPHQNVSHTHAHAIASRSFAIKCCMQAQSSSPSLLQQRRQPRVQAAESVDSQDDEDGEGDFGAEAAAAVDSRRIMIFCNTVPSCRAVEHFLRGHGFATACCHGDMPLQVSAPPPPPPPPPNVFSFLLLLLLLLCACVSVCVQLQTRSADFNEFISGTRPVLVCTDIAARGLDTTFVEVRVAGRRCARVRKFPPSTSSTSTSR